MRRDLSIEDLGDLVSEPHVAVLATHWSDGTVLLSPVWQEWRDGGFNVTAGGDDVKLKHLKRDPRASLVLFDDSLPYRGLEVRTTARLVTEGADEIQRRLAIRYEGEEAGEAYADTLEADGDGVIIRLEPGPGEMRTWDFADDF